jgi:AIPR protein
MIFKFKVSSFRNQYESPDGRRLCVFTAPVSNIPAEWEEWRDVNVRDTNKRGDVFNAIISTLRNEPEEMIFRNLGITILSPEVEFDNKTNEVVVIFSDKSKHGIANGGHTFSAIREVLRTGHVDAEVKVECIVGNLETNERVSIVDGRNRSRAAQTHSLENQRDSYKPIERVLTSPYYRDRIAYSEFDVDQNDKRKDISIREILSYIYCLDAFEKNSHPIEAYSSKGSVVDFYASKDEKGKERRITIERASKLLPDVLRLRDVIYRDLPHAYNDTGGKFGLLETMGVSKYKEPHPLRFVEDVTEFDYPDGFIYPILAAFRKYIDHRGDWSWKGGVDPFKVWEEKKLDAASAIKDAVGFSQNANKMGKAGATWRMAYDAI